MLTMFTLEKILETITNKPKTPPKKFQRSPKIMGYEREDNLEISSELNEPLLSSSQEKIDCDQGKIIIKGVNNKSSNNIRVKVLLTKEEAAKLLAKCKEEGVLDFKDVVKELMKLPAQRINVAPVITPNNLSKDLELGTILEEEEEVCEEYDNKKNR